MSFQIYIHYNSQIIKMTPPKFEYYCYYTKTSLKKQAFFDQSRIIWLWHVKVNCSKLNCK